MKDITAITENLFSKETRIITKASYAELFDRIQDPILLLDPESFTLKDFNPAMINFFGLNDYYDGYNINIFELIKPQDLDKFTKHLGTLTRRYNNKQFQTMIYLPQISSWKYIDIMMGSLEIGDNKKVIQLIFKDITEMVLLNKQLESLSITDGLTELYNKRYFEQKMASIVEHSLNNNKPFCLIMMDIDNFKHYNDRNGHVAGDKLLQEFSHEIRQRIRGNDIACRYGGEEFAIICAGTLPEESFKIADRIKTYITKRPFDHATAQPLGCISASMGIGYIKPEWYEEWKKMDLLDKQDFIKNCVKGIKEEADNCLYDSKKDGRNKITMK